METRYGEGLVESDLDLSQQPERTHPRNNGWRDIIGRHAGNRMVADYLVKSLRDSGQVVIEGRPESSSETHHIWAMDRTEFELRYPSEEEI